jgi:undecaprenyl-diphosphatase
VTDRQKWWTWVLGIHLLAAAALLAAARYVIRLDHWIDRTLYGRLSESQEHVCYVLLQAGSSHVIAIVGAVVAVWLIVARRWKRLVIWGVLLAGCVLLDAVLKRVFHRLRPMNMQGWPGWSFPSGHLLAVTAVYGMIAYFVRRMWAVVVVATLILVTASTLVLPGYHYLSDLVAGYFVGAAWLGACAAWATRWERSTAGSQTH